jgi:uncharacterized protein (TIGR03437 family)
MNQILPARMIALAILAGAFPIAVLADVSENTLLQTCSALATDTLPSVSVGNIPATVYGAALASGSAGLYQIAIQIPGSLTDGDWPLQATIGGVPSPTRTILSVHQ